MCWSSLLILTWKLALNAGSSKQGNAALADKGSNWVAASQLIKRKTFKSIFLLNFYMLHNLEIKFGEEKYNTNHVTLIVLKK